MTYEQENDHLLKVLLTERFFKPWMEPQDQDKFDAFKSLWSDSRLELYLTSSCNQKCEYCYLIRHPELYPQEFNNKEIILSNLKIFLNWLIENNFIFPEIELFSGEIWHTDFGIEVLDILLQACKDGLQCDYFMIPSNVSFLRNEKYTNLIQRKINAFKEINITLQFSISVDGKIIEDMTRPTNLNSDIKTDNFYEKMFLFAKHNNYYFHPMVSAYSIEKWIDNYKWWEENFKKYQFDIDRAIMMLEVRNNDWTNEKIEEYNRFIDFLFEQAWIKSNKNVALLTDNLYNIQCTDSHSSTYNPCTFQFPLHPLGFYNIFQLLF